MLQITVTREHLGFLKPCFISEVSFECTKEFHSDSNSAIIKVVNYPIDPELQYLLTCILIYDSMILSHASDSFVRDILLVHPGD